LAQTEYKGKGVLCSHCDKVNPPDVEECVRCGRGLYQLCKHCGKRNLNHFSTCVHCRRKTGGWVVRKVGHHRRRGRKLLRELGAKAFSAKFNTVQFIIVLIVVLVLYKVITFLYG